MSLVHGIRAETAGIAEVVVGYAKSPTSYRILRIGSVGTCVLSGRSLSVQSSDASGSSRDDVS